jgi:hypothetical protein
MSSACNLLEDVLCGCCAGLTHQTPQAIINRPALSEVSYRVGTYSTFLTSMLAALSDPDLPALSALRTRDSSDFTIALLDACAVSLDVLTFYQERFANEAFLRTAVDQRSVFELARLIGYIPSPGVAASAVLAFTLSSATGSPDKVLIPAGTRVQSVPGPNQTPQIFETSSDLTAKIALNALPAQTHLPWQLSPGDVSTWIIGAANNINPSDALLFIATDSSGRPIGTGPADLRYVSNVEIDSASGNTQIWWNAPLGNTVPAATGNVAIYVFRKKAALFGAQAINPFLLPSETLANVPGAPPASGLTISSMQRESLSIGSVGSIAGSIEVGRFHIWTDWDFQPTSSNQVNLDAAYAALAPAGNAPGQIQWMVLTNANETAVFQLTAASESNPNRYALSAKTSLLTLSPDLIVLAGSPGSSLGDALSTFSDDTRSTTAYVSSNLLAPATLPITTWNSPEAFSLASGMIVPVCGTSISVSGGQIIAAGQPIGISGKYVRLQVTSGDLALFAPANSSGVLAVTEGQVFLVNAFPPVLDTTGLLLWSVSTLSGVPGTLSLTSDNLQLLPADKNDPYKSEAALVSVVSVTGDITLLSLASTLSGIYDATTVTVNANAVESTHGETVQEILGNGDGTNGGLQFTLKQSPLTYVSAATGNGSQSTLQVWINNLQWHEVPNLLAAGPSDRVFTSRISPQGSRTVQFGDGTDGARTPTGQMNIRSRYRKGIGSAGMVSASQLSQPLDRPQGVRSVANPSPASGAADPATAADARQSAPLPTLTIGRVVSLEDYQNFALNFAGIAKALATWSWFGARRGVFLTVAGANGAVLEGDDPVVLNLIAAIQSGGNPFIPLQVASYIPVLFQIAASVRVDTVNYDSGQVLANVWSNLQAAFAFSRQQLAQSVIASQLVEIIQNTPGVIATQLSALNVSGQPAQGSVPAMLCASGPLPPQGAHMLLLDRASQGMIGGWS